MSTAPSVLTLGQMKDLASAVMQAIPTDLPAQTAKKWLSKKGVLRDKIQAILLEEEVPPQSEVVTSVDTQVIVVSPLPAINWEAVYDALGLKTEYTSTIATLPMVENEHHWTIPMVNGLTHCLVVNTLKKQDVAMYLYYEDLDKDVVVNDRDPNRDGSYAISFKKFIEANEEYKNLSANDLKQKGVQGITLLERLLLELGYFLMTKSHLDIQNWTLCSGSRGRVGGVPCVYWNSGLRGVRVDWSDPGDRYQYLRTRSAVSLPAKPSGCEAQQA